MIGALASKTAPVRERVTGSGGEGREEGREERGGGRERGREGEGRDRHWSADLVPKRAATSYQSGENLLT